MLDRLRGKDVLELCGIKVFDKSSLSHFPSHVQREATLFPLGSLAGALLCSGWWLRWILWSCQISSSLILCTGGAVGHWHKGIISPNDHFSLPAISKLQANREKLTHLNQFMWFCLFFFPPPFRSKIKSPKSFKKPYSISMMLSQYGSGMTMLPGQEVSIPSTDEFRDTSLAQEHLLAQLQLEKIQNKR